MKSPNKKELKGYGMHIEEEGSAIDLVCGMELSSKETAHASTYKDRHYYFCSQQCKEHFIKDPEKYLG